MEQVYQIDRLLSYLEHDPGNPVLLCNLIHSLLENRRIDEAREWLQKALIHASEDPGVIALQGQFYLGDGDALNAECNFQKLLDLGHTHESVFYNLAYASLLQGNAHKAKDILKSADTPFLQAATCLLLVRCLHQTGDLDEALAALSDVHADEAVLAAQVNGIRALIYLDKEDLQESRQWAEKTMAIDPGNFEALIAMAYCDFSAAELDTASYFFDRVLKIRPDSGRAHLGKGLLMSLSNQQSKAIEHFNQALRDMPEHLGTWNAKAWAEILQGEFKQAEQSLLAARNLEPRFAETQGTLAVVYAVQGKWDQAEKLAKLAMRLDKYAFSAQFAQVLVMENKGDTGTARQRLDAIYQRPVSQNGSLESHIQQFLHRTKP
ncbi:CDC27 family protein [Parendozoicomonas haliclonae]|uniref:Tetratricopeptide repeat protein n=2 Tax=Parendozoicomonas haliclonae TaxID=1960125 RepID=A0A1X7AP58_9GAMM|nr:tetratricopeptide repeat protein [Parendozoicomonas haliclonae]